MERWVKIPIHRWRVTTGDAYMHCFRCAATCVIVSLLVFPAAALAHPTDLAVAAQVRAFLEGLDTAQRDRAAHVFDSPERHNFRWTPGSRSGVRLDELDETQTHQLRDILQTVLSESGVRKIDSILATEAALGVIENAPDYRSVGKYYTAVFGTPGPAVWALRFEGHHLSVNLSFDGDTLTSATPLFLGANPETISSGPDEGLRALHAEVDRAFALLSSLSPEQLSRARGSNEWFAGFLTKPGERRVNLGKPAGIPVAQLSAEQSEILKSVVRAYLETITPSYVAPYLDELIAGDWADLHFYWKGAMARGEGSYYYRIAGHQLLIEHDGRSGGNHIHAIWRDVVRDFGGR